MKVSFSKVITKKWKSHIEVWVANSGGSKARRPRALARAPGQFFCNFLCKFLWISYINPYKLGDFFRFFDYLLSISYVNSYKCVANFFCPGFTIILAPPLVAKRHFHEWLIYIYIYIYIGHIKWKGFYCERWEEQI